MKLLIDIPKEFEQHFQTDRFEDSLHRLSADAHLLAGNYEQETVAMLIKLFKNAIPVPPHGRLIDADAYESLLRGLGDRNYRREKGTICDAIKFLHPHYAPTIIEAEENE